jgi:hypothetical protein
VIAERAWTRGRNVGRRRGRTKVIGGAREAVHNFLTSSELLRDELGLVTHLSKHFLPARWLMVEKG